MGLGDSLECYSNAIVYMVDNYRFDCEGNGWTCSYLISEAFSFSTQTDYSYNSRLFRWRE